MTPPHDLLSPTPASDPSVPPPAFAWRLRTLLLGLAAALLLPTLLLAGAAIWQAASGQRQAAENRLRDTAQGLALALDREVAGVVAALTAYATSPAFTAAGGGPDLAVLDAQARRIAASLGANIFLGRPDGSRLLTTRQPPGAPLPPLNSTALVERVFATGRPAVGDLVTGSVSGAPSVSIGVPVRGADGAVAMVAGASFEADQIRALLLRQGLPPGSFAAMTDAADVVVARSDALHDRLVGQHLPPENTARFAGRMAGTYRATALDGTERLFAFHAVPSAPGWTMAVAQPAAEFAAGWRALLDGLALGGLLALLLGSALALLAARPILRPVEALRIHARAVAQGIGETGGAARLPPARVAELEDLRQGFAAAESALRAREAEFAQALEATADGVLILDRDWRVVFLSRRGAALLTGGRDLAGEVLWDVFPEAVGGPFRQAYHRSMTARVSATADAFYAPLGRHFEAESHPRSPEGIIVFFRDVTERRAAAARLAESEARLRMALQAGQVGTFDWDIRSGGLDWDARTRAFWGVAPDIPLTIETFYAGLDPEDVPRLEAIIAAALDPAGDGAFRAEYRVVALANAQERHLIAHGQVLFEAGRAVRMLGTVVDVTAQRQATEILAREAEQLGRLAEERGRALVESEARLAEAARMEALGRLAGGIAHDFNNVLQAVQGGLKLAERRLPPEAGAARRYLTMALDATQRGAAVTGRLLSFARRGELRAEPVAAAPLLESLAEMLRHTLGPDLTLRVEVSLGLPPLLADRAQLEAVLVNLANNARDAMPRGGTLRLRAEAMPPATLRPPGLPPGRWQRLSVQDEGEGMPPEVLARVTEPFFTTKPRGQGTGLGLAMARSFAEQSGGALAIESAPGQGTTVALWLPEAPAGQADGGGTPDAAARAGGAGALVLLVEDEPQVREVLAAGLAEHGFRVEAAPDGAAAVAMLQAGLRPEAVLTDLAMPGGLDGLAMLRELRRILPRLPAVLLTGHAEEAAPEQVPDADRAGPFALLRKPAGPELLAARLAAVIGQAERQRAPAG
ncbi:ATP-binding protein [Paracraurococcus lichenis]|uniref:histidine kinase n=1 Tax=Paracraurococcus lichenis TaxID=3064888 RepID=A0ABT9E7L5_9PROT|nr:ATP-binding protein [Paracraurococcus sp. LOR1-02]MDO9712174.1 ATP-binding protein [Paracraurococcus sp. LOR1-02]